MENNSIRAIIIFLFTFTVFAQGQGLKPVNGLQIGFNGLNKVSILSIGGDGIQDGDGVVSSYDIATTAYFDRLDSLGITYNAALKTEYNDYLFKPLRDSSLIDSIVCLYILVSDSSLTLADTTRLKQNLLSNKFTLVSVNALTWQLGLGVAGNGTSSYLKTEFNPSYIFAGYDSTVFKRNSCGIGVYSRTDGSENKYQMGVTADPRCELALKYAGTLYVRINVTTQASYTPANTLGYFAGVRIGDSVLAYQNGTRQTGVNAAATGMCNDTLFICASNNGNGTPTLYSAKQLSIAVITGGISYVGQRKLNNILEAWVDYKGLGVQ